MVELKLQDEHSLDGNIVYAGKKPKNLYEFITKVNEWVINSSYYSITSNEGIKVLNHIELKYDSATMKKLGKDSDVIDYLIFNINYSNDSLKIEIPKDSPAKIRSLGSLEEIGAKIPIGNKSIIIDDLLEEK